MEANSPEDKAVVDLHFVHQSLSCCIDKQDTNLCPHIPSFFSLESLPSHIFPIPGKQRKFQLDGVDRYNGQGYTENEGGSILLGAKVPRSCCDAASDEVCSS